MYLDALIHLIKRMPSPKARSGRILYKLQLKSEEMNALARKLSIGEQLAAFAWLQALGTNIAALGQTKSLSNSKRDQERANELSIIGNAMQSIANAAQAELTAELWRSAANNESNELIVVGNLLQSVGNALQVIAGYSDKSFHSNNRSSIGSHTRRGKKSSISRTKR